MDYSKYRDFPFPSDLSGEERKARDFFLALPDGEQLRMLHGCLSYKEFFGRVTRRMGQAESIRRHSPA
ncbi:MAG TPA: hypothetical protein DEB16_05510 [Ruminococcaceae bacterium]|jgi:hypothetical protein|nr:hypothetical protein [Oscillospiraceae bacterium]HBT91283.1 hypothetical protein [Oscillospiraceae bacterium]HCB90541.1 hypothetical protein [Oscillospiraceae bacterium]